MINIVFATYNGSETLPAMLEAFCSLDYEYDCCRIIAVDNGSTDDTLDILFRYTQYLPLEVLVEKNRGKNFALNKALHSIDGELIIFTDDDVIPDKKWLVDYIKVAKRLPEYDIFGGSINVHWPYPPPEWLISEVNLASTFGSTHNLREGPCRPKEVWGANMCVRSRVFSESFIAFNENVGPGYGNYAMGSETDFVVRATEAGYRCWHTKLPSVSHIVRPHQIDQTWLLHRAYRSGRARGQESLHKNSIDIPKQILGVPRWRLRVLICELALFAFNKIKGNKSRSFRHLQNVSYIQGVLYEQAPNWLKPLLRK